MLGALTFFLDERSDLLFAAQNLRQSHSTRLSGQCKKTLFVSRLIGVAAAKKKRHRRAHKMLRQGEQQKRTLSMRTEGNGHDVQGDRQQPPNGGHHCSDAHVQCRCADGMASTDADALARHRYTEADLPAEILTTVLEMAGEEWDGITARVCQRWRAIARAGAEGDGTVDEGRAR